MSLYRLHGSTPIAVSKDKAQAIGCDIFIRADEARAWIVEVAGRSPDDKPRLHSRVNRGPLVPSFVVETRLGYQLHFAAKHYSPDLSKQLVNERIAPGLHAAPVTFARKPGYYDGQHLVSVVWRHSVSYTDIQIAQRFPRRPPLQTTQPVMAPISESLLVAPTSYEENVVAGALNGLLEYLPHAECDHFLSPARHVWTAIRNLDARGVAIKPGHVHAELVAYDRLAGRNYEGQWTLERLEQLASVPIGLVDVLAYLDQLDEALHRRRLVLALDEEDAVARQQQDAEIDDIALRDVEFSASGAAS